MPICGAGHQTLRQHFLSPPLHKTSVKPLDITCYIPTFQSWEGCNCIIECQMQNQYFSISITNPKGIDYLTNVKKNQNKKVSQTYNLIQHWYRGSMKENALSLFVSWTNILKKIFLKNHKKTKQQQLTNKKALISK